MIPVEEQSPTPEECIPRESGDDPLYGTHNFPLKSVFPARAGMILKG